MTLAAGIRLGSYQIVSPLGQGGMGEVYRATDTKLGRDVALKVLPAAVAHDPDRLARFDREARTLATLNHPNIAAIHGVEDTEGIKALVMELVEGPTLADRIAVGPLPVDVTLAIAKQIAEALEAAHEQGIVHRDLKPANVKVRPDGTVKVLDFGLAKAMGQTDVDTGHSERANLTASPTLSIAATQHGIVLGTAAYMSPEQAKGLPVDRRADIFAFGSVLFEMLTGKRAFRGELIAEVMASVINQEPEYAWLNGNVPARLVKLLRRCLRKDPRQRWQAAGDLRIELDELLQNTGATDTPISTHSGVSRWLGWAVAAVAVAAGATAWFLKPSEPRLVNRVAVDLVAAPELYDAIAISPDGRRIVYPAQGRLWIHGLESQSTPIPGTENGSAPFFNPDGTRLAFFALTQLKIVDLRGGLPVPLATIDQGVMQGTWDERGRIIFGRVGPSDLSMIPETGGAVQALVPLGKEIDIDFPDALPGGEWVIFSRQRTADWNDAQIVARSVVTGEERELVDGGYYGRYVSSGHLVYARGGSLYALRFDLDRIAVLGDSVPVVEDVQMLGYISGQAQYAVSRNGTLVYRKGTDNTSELRLIESNGDSRRLDLPRDVYAGPRLSPDGTRFVVETVAPDGKSRINIHAVDGATQGRQLAANATDPVWIDDARIAYEGERAGVHGVYVQRADGMSSAELLLKAPAENPWVPQSISPDRRHLLLLEGSPTGGLFYLSMSGGQPQAIPGTTGGLAGGATFSPDGKWIVYQWAIDRRPLTMAIHVQPFPPSGAVAARISPNPRLWPTWSRNDEIVYMTSLLGESVSLAAVRRTPDGLWERERTLPITVSGHRLQRSFDIDSAGRMLVAAPGQQGRAQLHLIMNWVEDQRLPR